MFRVNSLLGHVLDSSLSSPFLSLLCRDGFLLFALKKYHGSLVTSEKCTTCRLRLTLFPSSTSGSLFVWLYSMHSFIHLSRCSKLLRSPIENTSMPCQRTVDVAVRADHDDH